MKKFLSLNFFMAFAYTVSAQCATSADIHLDINNITPTYGDCYTLAEDMSHVQTYENFFIYLTLPDDATFDLLLNGSPVPHLVHYYPNNDDNSPPTWAQAYRFFRNWITDPGIYTYELRVYQSGCPTIIKTHTIEIFERDCPYIDASYVGDALYCFGRDTSLEVQLVNMETNDPIIGANWEIYHYDYPFYTPGIDIIYDESIGDSYAFSWPNPGNYTGLGLAKVSLPDGTVCLSKIGSDEGFSCVSFSVPVLFTDPYFELEGNLECGQNISLIFKGDRMYKTSIEDVTYDDYIYKLYLNGTMIANFTNLQYNDLVYLFPSLAAGNNTILLTGQSNKSCIDSVSYTFNVENPCTVSPPPCESCNTFRPEEGERYWVSAWVKEGHSSPVKTYAQAHLSFGFTGSGVPAVNFYPSGDIVEGWQRIVGSFTIPLNTTALDIKLVNGNSGINAYFDDIRVHPFNSSMKSYVYDPATFWLTAELDDNNYATFYEYDKEGQLIRIKKETSRGIMTIQESRSSNPKRQ